MKRLLISIVWLPAMIVTLCASILFYRYRSDFLLNQAQAILDIKETASSQIYNSLPKVLGFSITSAKANDPAIEKIRQYFRKYKAPLRGTAGELVKICREYDIDPFLLVAIAQCETNLGRKSPEECYNPFGLGVYGKKKICFDDWEQSYQTMAKTLRKRYFDQGLITPEQIMTRYCPVSIEKADGHWAKCVNRFLKEAKNTNL